MCKSEKDFKNKQEKHSQNCEGKFELARGDCLIIAIKNILENVHWEFCYSFVKGEIKGQKYIHAWNESKGYTKIENKRIEVITNNLKEKNLRNFAFDFSNGNSFAGEKEKYYRIMGIKEKDVKKIKIEKLLENVLHSIKEANDLWTWIYD